jgi:hypothetical protein
MDTLHQQVTLLRDFEQTRGFKAEAENGYDFTMFKIVKPRKYPIMDVQRERECSYGSICKWTFNPMG